MSDRQSLNDALEVFFRLRPNTWIDGKVLADVAGGYAWRSRCSDIRRRGMTIENRLRKLRTAAGETFTISEYRYVPSESVTLRVDENGQQVFI